MRVLLVPVIPPSILRRPPLSQSARAIGSAAPGQSLRACGLWVEQERLHPKPQLLRSFETRCCILVFIRHAFEGLNKL